MSTGHGPWRRAGGVIEREWPDIGIFLTLTEPSRPMITKAAGAGLCEVAGIGAVPVDRGFHTPGATMLGEHCCFPCGGIWEKVRGNKF